MIIFRKSSVITWLRFVSAEAAFQGMWPELALALEEFLFAQ